MRAVLRLVVHKLRARWQGWVVLALLVGLGGGAVLTAAAGALRTDSAYPRFLEKSKASDVLVSPIGGPGFGGYYKALARLPDVAAIAPLVGLQALPLQSGAKMADASVIAPLDGRLGHLLEIPKMLAGRQPAADRPAEVMVNQIAAQSLHLQVGSRLEMEAFAGEDISPTRLLSERVVGIMVTRGSVVPVTDLDRIPVIIASAALFRALGPRYEGFDGAYVKLRPGAPLGGFNQMAQALARGFPATGGQVIVTDETTQAATIERSIRPQAAALALFALVLALSALLIVGQVASRLLLAASQDNGTLAVLGMTRGQLLAAGLVEVGIAAAAGAVMACAVAIAASPLMPIGPARLAEPDPGVSVDIAALAVGVGTIVSLLLARVAWPAWRQATRHPEEHSAAEVPDRHSRTAEWLARVGAPVTAVTGVRLALDSGQGRTAAPVRSALVGTALAVAAVAAAVTFGANLLHLVNTPRLYGQDWDVALDLQFSTITPQRFDALTARVPGIAGWTYGFHGTLGIGRTVVPAIGLAAGRGPLESPTLQAGHPPQSVQQIVLGTSLLSRTGLHVGQSLPVTAGGHRQLARIVGSAVFPYFGEGSFTPTDLGEGAEGTASLLESQADPAANGGGYNFVLVKFVPGPRKAADITDFERAMGPLCATIEQSTCVVTDQRPNAVANYARIDGTPDVLAGILAVLGLAMLTQFIVASARRRRRDFAIMKVLGLIRRQLNAVTAWQVTTLTGLALLLGIPLGVAGGHWAWELFAANVGLSPDATTPMSLLLIIPVTIVAANVIALRPGRLAARLSPAAVLRAE